MCGKTSTLSSWHYGKTQRVFFKKNPPRAEWLFVILRRFLRDQKDFGDILLECHDISSKSGWLAPLFIKVYESVSKVVVTSLPPHRAWQCCYISKASEENRCYEAISYISHFARQEEVRFQNVCQLQLALSVWGCRRVFFFKQGTPRKHIIAVRAVKTDCRIEWCHC